MDIHLSPSYILHTRPFKETSLLLEVFSQTHGRLSFLAKGVRGPKGRWQGLLQPFYALLLSWFQGCSDLYILKGVEIQKAQLKLPANRLIYGLYLNELLYRLMNRGDPSSKLYDGYVDTLNQLCDMSTEIEPSLRKFELRLLECLGYAIDLSQDALTGKPIEADRVYGFDPNMGLMALDKLPNDPYPILVTLAGASILALHEGHYTNMAQLQDAKRLLRAAIGCHLGHKPLKCREIAHRLLKTI